MLAGTDPAPVLGFVWHGWQSRSLVASGAASWSEVFVQPTQPAHLRCFPDASTQTASRQGLDHALHALNAHTTHVRRHRRMARSVCV